MGLQPFLQVPIPGGMAPPPRESPPLAATPGRDLANSVLATTLALQMGTFGVIKRARVKRLFKYMGQGEKACSRAF